MSKKLSDSEYLDFIVSMKRKARRKNGSKMRVAYSQADRECAVRVCMEVDERGGSIGDAADIMGMNTSTLVGWLRSATDPDSDWTVREQLSTRLNAAVRAHE